MNGEQPEPVTVGMKEARRILGTTSRKIRLMIQQGRLANLGTDTAPKFALMDLEALEGVPDLDEEGETTEHTEHAEKKEKAQKAPRSIDQPSPEQLYEEYRTDPNVWRPGITRLWMRKREIYSDLFVPCNPPWRSDMPTYEKLASEHPEGAVLEITVQEPNKQGVFKAIRAPLRLNIGHTGEAPFMGYDNPYSARGAGGNGREMNPLDFFKVLQQAQATATQQAQAQSSGMMQLLTSPALTGGKNEMVSAMVLMSQIQAQQQIAAQQLAAQQAQSNKQLIIGLITALAPFLAPLLSKGTDQAQIMQTMLTTIQQSSTEQNKILLTAALARPGEDIEKTLATFQRIKSIIGDDDAGGISGLAKLFDSAGLGTALTTLAQAGATRIAGTAPTPPALPPSSDAPPALPNPYDPPAPATPTPPPTPGPAAPSPAEIQAAIGQLKGWLDLVAPAYKAGKDPVEEGKAFFEANKQNKATLAQREPAWIVAQVRQYAPMVGHADLTTTDALDWLTDFCAEVYRLASAP